MKLWRSGMVIVPTSRSNGTKNGASNKAWKIQLERDKSLKPNQHNKGPTLKRILTLALSALVSSLSATAQAEITTIPARSAYIVDGDTFIYQRRSYRLHGIDAPEDGQLYEWNGKTINAGWLAAGALDSLISNRRIACETLDVDHWGRLIVRCRNLNGLDINAAMVRAGYAFAYRQYSMDYVQDEDEARRKGNGLWQYGLDIQMPWVYRRNKN